MILPFNDPEPVDFRRRPLVGAPAARPWPRAAVFAVGLLIGLLAGLLA